MILIDWGFDRGVGKADLWIGQGLLFDLGKFSVLWKIRVKVHVVRVMIHVMSPMVHLGMG